MEIIQNVSNILGTVQNEGATKYLYKTLEGTYQKTSAYVGYYAMNVETVANNVLQGAMHSGDIVADGVKKSSDMLHGVRSSGIKMLDNAKDSGLETLDEILKTVDEIQKKAHDSPRVQSALIAVLAILEEYMGARKELNMRKENENIDSANRRRSFDTASRLLDEKLIAILSYVKEILVQFTAPPVEVFGQNEETKPSPAKKPDVALPKELSPLSNGKTTIVGIKDTKPQPKASSTSALRTDAAASNGDTTRVINGGVVVSTNGSVVGSTDGSAAVSTDGSVAASTNGVSVSTRVGSGTDKEQETNFTSRAQVSVVPVIAEKPKSKKTSFKKLGF